MSIDPYSLCPGGTGKKVKFCCSDLVQDLDKVTKLLEAEQPTACLELVRKLDEKYPGRACLQCIHVSLEQAVGDEAAAASTLDSFLAQHGSNPVALAQKAMQAMGEDPLAGIAWLQKALEASGKEMPVQVYDAIGALGFALFAAQYFLPARLLFQFQVGISGAKDQQALTALWQFENAPGVPVLFKDLQPLAEPPAGVAWKAEFQQALEAAQQGRWQRAADIWTGLSQRVTDSRELWRNLAAVRGGLADYAGAAIALRKYAALCQDQLDAIEAEAFAQLLTKADEHGNVDEISLTVPISSDEAVQEKLAVDRRFERVPVDPTMWTEANEPPPRAAFGVLDRAMPTTGVGISREQIPNSLAQILLFGKQTDREAQLVITLYRPEFDAAMKTLREVAGEWLGTPKDEQVLGQLSQVEHALSWHWRIPDDTPDDQRAVLADKQRRAMVLERWPAIAQPMFGGRNAEQAASEPQYRLKLLAAIWLLQLSDSHGSAETYEELRQKLGLPAQSEWDATGLDMNRVSLARLAWVKIDTLSDEQLRVAFNRAATTGFAVALRRLAPAVIERPNMPAVESKLAAYRFLARTAANAAEALRLIDEGRKLAEANQQSSAPWDLMELAMAIEGGDAQTVGRLIDHLRRHHSREQGVMQSLVNLLVQTGMMTPDGRFVGAAPGPAQAEPSLIVPGAGSEPGKLWTPDAPQGGGEKKSALWIPD